MTATTVPALERGDRVTLYVSDCPDRASGTVEHVHTDAAGQQVAEVRLASGAIAIRNAEFLRAVSPR